MHKHSLKHGLFITGLIAALFAVISCTGQVGLGSEIDVSAPIITITYPETSSVVRGKFVLAGTVKDDMSVKKITVYATNSDNPDVTYDFEDAVLSTVRKDSKGNRCYNWAAVIDPFTEDNKVYLPDGKYSFIVYATDNFKRTSAISSRSIEIDNTAPFFSILTPGATVLNDSSKIYGSSVNIEGYIAEDHDVSAIELSIFDSNKNLLTSWVEKNINIAGSTSVTFAKIFSNDSLISSSTDETWNNRYREIYDVTKGGNQGFYASVKIYDSAKTYKTPTFDEGEAPVIDFDGKKEESEASQGEAGNSDSGEGSGAAPAQTLSNDKPADELDGNFTSKIWLYDDICGESAKTGCDFLGTGPSSYRLKIKDVRNILYGSYIPTGYENWLASETLETVSKKIDSASIDTNSSDNYLAFKLNKDASPKYSFVGYSFEETNAIGGSAAKSGTITLQGAVGLDGAALVPSTVKVYLFGPYTLVELNKLDINSIYANPSAALPTTKGEIIYKGNDGSSTTSLTVPIILPDTISPNMYYLIAAEGKDKNDNNLESSGFFGFKGVTSGYPPTVRIESPAQNFISNDISILKNVKAAISSSESFITAAEYEVTVRDIVTGTILGKLVGSAKAKEQGLSQEFEFDITAGEWVPNAGVTAKPFPSEDKPEVDYNYTISVTGIDAATVSASSAINGQIDTLPPELNVSSVSPVASIDENITEDFESTIHYVNGKVTCTGNIIEENIADVVIQVIGDTSKYEPEDSGKSLGAITNFNKSFYLYAQDGKFVDGETITATITATDKAGNVSSVTTTIKTDKMDYRYILSMESDLPTIVLNAEDESTISLDDIAANKNLFGTSTNNKITGTISDDDFIGSVSLEIASVDGSFKDSKNFYVGKNKTSYSLNYTLPKKEGKYILTMVVTDGHNDSKETVNTVTKKYYLGIDAGVPSLQFTTTNKGKTAASTAKIVTGTASDSSGIASLKRYAVVSSDSEIDITVDDNATLGELESEITLERDGSWSDTIPAEGIGNRPGRRRYVVTDIYGNETSLDFIYYVDSEPPVIKEINTPVDLSVPTIYNGNNVYSIKGKVADNEKEFSRIVYLVSQTAPETVESPIQDAGKDGTELIYKDVSSWAQATLATSKNADAEESTSFTANIDLSGEDKLDGTYSVYFAVFDEANNQSYVDTSKVVTLISDKTEPVITYNELENYYTTLPLTINGKIIESNLTEIKAKITKTTSSLTNKTVEDKEGILITGEDWSYEISEAGSYSIIFTATDAAGLTGSVATTLFVIDTQVPTIIPDQPSSGWITSGSQAITAYVTDSLDNSSGKVYSSGFDTVTYSVNGSSPVELVRGSACDSTGARNPSGSYNIFNTTYNFEEGENQVVIVAQDIAGNISPAKTITFKIDTEKPVVSDAVLKLGASVVSAGLTAQDIANFATTPVKLYVTVSDATSTIDSVQIYENDSPIVLASNAVSVTGNSYVITMPSSVFTTGAHTFTVVATDKAGLVNKEKSVSMTVDQTPPVITSIDYGIDASMAKVMSNGDSVVNGIVYVGGTVTDETRLGTTGAISWKLKSGATVKKSGIEDLTSGNKSDSFLFEVDASDIADGTYTLEVTVKDAVSNVSSVSTATITTLKESDKPIITVTNADDRIASVEDIYKANTESYAAGDVRFNNANIFSKKMYITASLSDDDGIGKVVVGYRIAGSDSSYEEKTIISNGTSKNYSLSYQLPDIENIYEIKIDVTDTYGNTTSSNWDSSKNSSKFVIAVDNGMPSISLSTMNNQNYPANTVEVITGLVSDGNGIKSVTSSNDSATVNYDSDSSSWNSSFNSGVSDTNKITYTAEDILGNKNSITFSFSVDVEVPEIADITNPTALNDIINGTSVYLITGSVTDNKKLSSIKYKVAKSSVTVGTTASPIQKSGTEKIYSSTEDWSTGTLSSTGTSATFTLNVGLGSENGDYKVYIALFDASGNQSYVGGKSSIALKNDTVPPAISVNNVASYNTSAVTVSGTIVETNLDSFTVKNGNNTETIVPAANGTWSYTLSNAGIYSLAFNAVDKAGNKAETKNVETVIDTQIPIIIPGTVADTWFNSSSQTIKAYITDTLDSSSNKVYSSGVEEAVFKVNGDSVSNELSKGSACDNTGTKVSGGSYNIYSSSYDFADGTNTVALNVRDAAGNKAVQKTLTYKIDTRAPVLGTVTSSKTGFNTSTIADFTVTVASVDDKNGSSTDVSGVESIYIMKGSDKVVETTGLTGATATSKVLTVSKSFIADGSNTFTVYARDAAGNVSTGSNFTIDYDSVAPVVNVNSISPVALVSGDVNFVNGTISVKGTVNDTNTKTIKLIVSGNGKTKEYPQAIASSFTQDVDTTYFATGSSQIPLTIKVFADDTAGNENTYTVEDKYTADQTTDVPMIDAGDTSEDITLNDIALNRNLFGITSNNKFTATVTDDDGVQSVKVTVKKPDGTIISGADIASYGLSVDSNPYTESAGNKGSYKFSYKLPTKEGKYIVQIEATDKFGLAKVWTYNVGIDAGNPNVQFSVTNNARVGANVAKVVTGTATDSSGVKEIYRYLTTANSDAASISGEPQAKWVSGGSSNTITYNSSTGEWSDTIPATDSGSIKGIGTTPGRRRYIVRDIYGNETQLDFIYGVDAQAPVLEEITTPANVTAANVYNGNNIYSVIGKVSDNYKEFEKVLFYVGKTAPTVKASPLDGSKNIYDTTTGNWNTAVLSTTKNDDAKESTTFTCNVSLKDSADGLYKVYIAAFDQALIQSYVDSTKVVTLTTDKTSPVLNVTNLNATYNAASGLTNHTVPMSGTITESNLESFKITYKVRGADGTTTTRTDNVSVSGSNWSYNLVGPGNFESIRLVATDKAGFTAEENTTTLIDDVIPLMKVDPTTNNTDGNWKNSTTQKIQVLVGDKGAANTQYSSGISYVKYYLDGDDAGVEMAPGSARDANGVTSGVLAYNIYNATFDMTNGTHTLKVRAVDLAGNSVENDAVYIYKVDDHAPSQPTFDKSSTEINKSGLVSGVVVKVTSSDANAGAKGGSDDVSKISSVILKKGNTTVLTDTLASPAVSIANREITIPRDSIVTGTNTFTVYVQDAAGNISDGLDYTVTADVTDPTVTYTSHSSIIAPTVNKTINLEGTYSDNNEVKASSGILSVYNKTSSAWEQINTFSHNGDGTWSYAGLDTTLYDLDKYGTRASSGLRPVKFLVTFEDGVGNISSSDSYLTLNIDQNSDRPLIKLSNLEKTAGIVKSTAVYGTVSDDDGDVKGMWIIETAAYNAMATKKYPTTSADNGWSKAEVVSGSWTVDSKTEGGHSWYFYIIDAKDGIFTTVNTNAVNRPYIQGKSDAAKSDNSTAISFTADETGPAITMYVAQGSATQRTGAWKIAGEVFGGEYSYVWLKLEIDEAVGMKMDAGNPTGYAIPVVAVNGTEQTVTFASTPVVENGIYTYLLKPINLKTLSIDDGTVSISVRAYDSSLQPGNGNANLIYDNSAPEVTIVSPTTAVSDAVTSSVTIKGIVSDTYSSVSKLEWAIPVKANEAEYTTTTGDWTTVPATASWEINFSSGAQESENSLLYYAVNSTIYNVEALGAQNIYKVPLYFRITDSVGNVGVQKNQYVLADIDGGKPKAWISSPEEGDTTSGTITVYGGASDDISVARVEIAYSTVESSGYTTVTASGTNSWKYTLDTSGMTSLYLKVRAFDEENQTRQWTDPVHVTIDRETPTIKNLKVVQYGAGKSSGIPVTSRDYTAGMFLSNNTVAENGNWYLTGDVSDNNSVASIVATKMTSATTTIIDLPETILSGGTTADYKLNIPLTTNTSGQIYSVLKATDNAGAYTEQSVKINIDSTSPSLYNTSNAQSTVISDNLRLKSMSKTMGTESNNSTVANSNGYFTFGDTVIEAESGLAYMAFYFERDAANDSIYNPMVTNAGGANKTVLSSVTPTATSGMTNGRMYINKDNLPVLYVTGLLRSSEDSLTLASLGSNKNVRKGGLVRIGGSYSKIINVTSSGVVSFEPSVPTTFTTAEIVYAQVVDHQLTESVDGNGNVVNDDGDEMIESVSQIGTSYVWNASLDSTTIPDGPIYIRVAAIDNAGNVTTGKIATNVTNNRPRIAKVLLGTDLNNSGTYEFRGGTAPVTNINEGTPDNRVYGEFSYFSGLNVTTGEAQYNLAIASSSFKVKNGLIILPEFVGGNNITAQKPMKYILNFANSDSNAYQTSSDGTLTAMNTTLVSSGKVVDRSGTGLLDRSLARTYESGSIRGQDFGGIEVANAKISGSCALITFWDNTDETVQGSTSQWAHLRIPFTNMSTDKTAPVPTVKPFHWNSNTDNSVFIDADGVLQGHIELENDLSSSLISLRGSEPKVSGKIVLEGQVTDENLLSTVTVKFGTVSVTSTYTNGVWSKPSSGVISSFTVEDVDLSQEGHIVSWKAVVDTEKVSGVAADDVVFTVTAKDAGGNSTAATTTQTTAARNTAYYKMDVVPYITQIWTGLSETKPNNPSMYARSSTGEYVVRGKTSGATYKDSSTAGETITIYGWNFNSSPEVRLGGSVISSTISANTNENVKQGTYGIEMTVPDSSSNSISVTVNGIISVNNLNNNEAKGNAVENTTTYAGYYNRQPNGDNNNNLTDDVKIDIWDFKNAVTPVGTAAKYVHMKVGPYLSSNSERSGRIGFSFRNGAGFFNMPGYMYSAGQNTTINTMIKKQVDLYINTNLNLKAIHYWGDSISGDTSSPISLGSPVSYNSGNYYHITFSTALNAESDGSITDMKFLLTPNVGSWSGQTGNIQLSTVGEYIIDVVPSGKISPTHKSAYIDSKTISGDALYSQTKIGQNYQGFSHNTFTWDANGESYGAALCSDTSGNDDMSANFQFFSRGYGESVDSLNFNYYNCKNGRRIENTKNAAGTYDEERVKSPSMATFVADGKTYVYMAYWDHLENRIIYRVGSVGGTGAANANDIGLGLRDLCAQTSHHSNYNTGNDIGKIGSSGFGRRNSTESSYVGDSRAGESSAYHYVKVLENFAGVTDAHVSVTALSDGSAVIAWYNDVSSSLKAVKISKTDMLSQTMDAKSYTPVTISRNGGAYVSVVADAVNGLHFAYSSNSGANLYYAYANSSLSGINEMLVDVSDDVGDNCSIDVARKDTSSPWIPTITYKSNVATGTKIAYPVFASSASSSARPTAGSTSGGQYTGAWAICTLPTSNKSITDLISVGYNKDWADGTYKAFTVVSETKVPTSGVYSICDSTITSGNGTSNPVVGYGIATGSIEMAQKR